MPHWLANVVDILKSESGDLKILAELAGGQLSTFYVGADLSRADLRGQDLRGINFSKAELRGALLDENTVLDAAYDPRLRNEVARRKILLSDELIHLVRIYARRSGYIYTGWSVKNLIFFAGWEAERDPDILNTWTKYFHSSKSFVRVFKASKNNSVSVQIRDYDHLLASSLDDEFEGRSSGYTALILIGLHLATRVQPSNRPPASLDELYNRLGLALGMGPVVTPSDTMVAEMNAQMPIKKTWTEAVEEAVRRHVARTGDAVFTRQGLIEAELVNIVADTCSRGATPDMTLSRELQEMRDRGLLEFLADRGIYRLLD